MQKPSYSPHAAAHADEIIRERFASRYGVSTLSEYLSIVDARATAHVNEALRGRMARHSGEQRRNARIFYGKEKVLLIAIPIYDSRQSRTVWAQLEYGVWLDLVERGADTTWSLGRKGVDRSDMQVRCAPPLSGHAKDSRLAVCRLIVGARAGQQVRLRDGDPLNLTRDNLYVMGDPRGGQTRCGTAKHDANDRLTAHTRMRSVVSGRNFGIPEVA